MEIKLANYFGTDGIRGEVGVEPITADFFLKLGWAVGSVLSEQGKASVVIGHLNQNIFIIF